MGITLNSSIIDAAGGDTTARARARFARLYARFQAGVERARVNNLRINGFMASPPTITTSTTEPNSSNRTPPSATTWADYAPYIAIRGGWPTVTASAQLYGGVVQKATGTQTGGDSSTAYGACTRFIFYTDDPSPTFGYTTGRLAGFRIAVNDQYIGDGAGNAQTFNPGAVNTVTYYTLDFGSSAVRKITIDVQAAPEGAAFRGYIVGNQLTVTTLESGFLAVGQTISPGNGAGAGSITVLGTGTGGTGTYTLSNTQGTPIGSVGSPAAMASGSGNSVPQLRYLYPSVKDKYKIWAPQSESLRLIAGGDSITYGPVSNHIGTSRLQDNYARVGGDLLGIEDTWMNGASRSGWIWRGGSNVPNMLDRVDDFTAWSPDIIATMMRINDESNDGQVSAGITESPASLTTQVIAWLTTVRAALPYTPLIIFGGFRFCTSSNTLSTNYEAALKAAVDQFVASTGDKMTVFIPTWSSGSPAAWFIGTGDDVNPNNTGNMDLYESGRDRTHPNAAGHAYTARRWAQGIIDGMEIIRVNMGL